MAEEINAMLVNKTRDLVPFDASKKLVGTQWISTIKTNEYGHVMRPKARSVARRFG